MTDLSVVLPLFVLIGLGCGILTMVYGLGGGIILVPCIYAYLHYIGFNATVAMKVAVGTSLLNVLLATALACYRHHKKHNVVWPISRQLIPAVIVGSLLGLVLSYYLKGELLRELFIVFLIGVIINGLLSKSFKATRTAKDFRYPHYAQGSVVGLIIGGLSVLVGIGGGLLIIPYLRHLRMTMVQASATSASIASVIALCGTLGYAYLGLHAHANLPAYTIGFINVVIFLGIQIGSFFGIRIGESINNKMNDSTRAAWFPFMVLLMVVLMVV